MLFWIEELRLLFPYQTGQLADTCQEIQLIILGKLQILQTSPIIGAEVINMAQLKCPKCGSTDVYCGGMNPVQCNAVCRHCDFEVTGMQDISRFFEGQASYATYVAEKEAKETASEAARKKSEEFSRNLAAKQAACHHKWHTAVMDGVAFQRCPKCGATRL